MSGEIPILMYHRVAALDVDPHRMAVTPERFRGHIQVLAERFEPISLSEAVNDMNRSPRPAQPIVVTFDDGYADNVEAAMPVLEEFGVPATVFVSSGSVDSSREFWWDEVEALFLGPHELPEDLRIRLGGTDFTARTTMEEPARSIVRHADWSVRDSEAPPTPRHRAYRSLLEALKGLDANARATALDALHTWAGLTPAARETHRALTSEGVLRLATSDVIEVGAHTVSHPALSRISPGQRWSEISESRRDLEAMAGPVRHFSYPFGEWRGARRFVRWAGFESACVTASRRRRRVDRYRLPRSYVGDWDEEVFVENLARWESRR